VFDWAGVAVMKKAYQIYRQRGYRLRLLSAAFRNHLHWSEFIGGDVVISPPFEWQKRYNDSDVTVENRMERPVDPAVVEELERKFEDFRRAYDENGMTVGEFDSFGATRRTLRQFCKATDDLVAIIRDFVIPNPDL
jgi:transaldolase